MERWPNFFIVGAPKSGTSSIYAILYNHQEIYMSPIKEPNYFSSKTFGDNHHLRPIRDKKKYLDLFKTVNDEKIVGEASPSYLADQDAPKLIHEVSPTAKILISLRDPVERVYSHYLMLNRLGDIKSNFHELIQISFDNKRNKNEDPLWLGRGLYFDNVIRYISIFGKEQVKIIIFEDFVKNPQNSIKEILNFLNVEYDFFNFKPDVFNKYGLPRSPFAQKILRNRMIRRISELLLSPSIRRFLKEHFLLKEVSKPEMEEDDRELLINYYIQDVKKMENLLRRELPWKNFS